MYSSNFRLNIVIVSILLMVACISCNHKEISNRRTASCDSPTPTIILIAREEAKLRLESNPNDCYGYRLLAQSFVQENKYDTVVQLLSKCINLGCKSDTMYFNRSLSYINLKRYDLARYDLDSVLIINPKWPIAYQYRAYTHRMLNNKDAACKDYDTYLNLNPDTTLAKEIKVYCR